MLYQKIVSYCEKNHMSICSFEKKCGIGNGTVGRWEDGKSNPSLQTLVKIEAATGIPAADWIKTEREDV